MDTEARPVIIDEQTELHRLRREARRLHEEVQQVRTALGDHDAAALFAFIERERPYHAAGRLCRVLGVSPSGYWAWRTRTPSARAGDDARLLSRIREIHAASGGMFGAPRVYATLKAERVRCGHTRVARLIHEAGLRGAGGSQVH